MPFSWENDDKALELGVLMGSLFSNPHPAQGRS